MTLKMPRGTAGYCLAFIALGLAPAALGPTLPYLAEQVGVGLDEISLLFPARSLGFLVAAPFVGRLYDRVPGHPVLAGGLLAMAVLLAATPFLPVLALLAVVVFLTGMTSATVDVGGNTLILWAHRRDVGPYMNLLHFSYGIGAFLAPLLVAMALTYTAGITAAYVAMGILVLPAALWLLPVGSPRSPATDPDTSAHPPLDRRFFGLMLAFFLLYGGFEGSVGGWLYTYVLRQGLADATTAAYLNAAFWGLLMVGRLLAVPVAIRVPPRTLLMGALAGLMTCTGLLLLARGSFPLSLAAVAGLGLSAAVVFPTLLSYAERHVLLTGQRTSLFFIAANLGGMALPWSIGQMIEPLGPSVFLYVLLADLIGVAVIYALLRLHARPAASVHANTP